MTQKYLFEMALEWYEKHEKSMAASEYEVKHVATAAFLAGYLAGAKAEAVNPFLSSPPNAQSGDGLETKSS